MDESILDSIKKLLGIDEEDTDFDQDIIMHINAMFTVMMEIGVNHGSGFFITDSEQTWHNYVTDEWESYSINAQALVNMIKSWMYLRVKLIFDPPPSSSTAESFKRISDEFEWRISVAVDPGKEDK